MRPHRRRVHAHPAPGRESLDPAAGGERPEPHPLHAPAQARHPARAGHGGGVRALPARQVPRHQAVLDRGGGEPGPGAGGDHPRLRRARRRGNRLRHAASRAHQRAHLGDGQKLRRRVRRVPGQRFARRRRPRVRRREIPPRRVVGPDLAGRAADPPLHDRQPVAPRMGEPGGDGPRARQAGGARRRRPCAGHGGAAARRRRVRRAGGGGGDARHVGAARPPLGRRGPHRREQPDRLHHQPEIRALLALPVRRGEDGPGAHRPRQRRRPGGGGPRGDPGGGFPPVVPPRRGAGHLLLPPPRPQRDRRAGVHPAADVPPHRVAPDDAADLRRPSGQGRRAGRRRGGAAGGGVRRPARRRIRGGARAPRPQGGLAGGAVGRAEGGAGAAAPRRGDRSRRRAAARDRRGAVPVSRRVRGAPQDRPLPRRAPRRAGGGRGAGLGDRGGAGVREPAGRGPPGAPQRAGFGPRHVLAAPRGRRRPEDRGAAHSAQLHRPRPGAVRGHRLDAVGGGGAGLRIRLQPRRPEHAGAVGGAVRRLRQRRAGHYRQFHRRRRKQMAAHVGPRHAAAARLRGPGPRTQFGAAGAVPPALRRGQHAGRQLHDPRQLLPRPAAPDAAQVPQAAGADDAEIAAAPQARGLRPRRTRARRPVPARAAGPARRGGGRGRAPGGPVFGQGVLRPGRGARRR